MKPTKKKKEKTVVVMDERFTWPWSIRIYKEGGQAERLPLRLYPSTLWIYIRMVPDKLYRSFRKILHGLTQYGKCRTRDSSNIHSNKKGLPPNDSPKKTNVQS